MKYGNLPAFEKHLSAAALSHFSECYLIVSKDEFIIRQAVESLKSLYLKGEKVPKLCTGVFDGKTQPIATLRREFETLPMFSKRRLIIAYHVDALEKAATEQIEHCIANPNRSVLFVATASTLNRATTFYKKMEKAGVVLDAEEEKPWEKEASLVDWLINDAGKSGKKMAKSTSQLLVKQLGTDQQLTFNELHKLICYVGDRPTIADVDIAKISISNNLEDGWKLGSAIFRLDTSQALRISKNLISEGEAIIALLRQIRSQFQTDFQVCSMLHAGLTPADIAKEFPYMKGSILETHINNAKEYGMSRFKDGILAIDEAELEAKNSSADPDYLMERLIFKLTRE